MKYCVVLLAASLALGFAQAPKKCTTPPTWEARVMNVEYTENRGGIGRFYYDAYNQRTSFFEEEFSNGQVIEVFQTFEIYKEKVRYSYDVRENTCIRRELTEPFRPINITATARFVDSFVIGTNADQRYGVLVNLWEDYTSFGRVMMEYVADDGDGDENCYPISFTEIGQRGVRHQSFFNIVKGVNPDHFIPPRECNEK